MRITRSLLRRCLLLEVALGLGFLSPGFAAEQETKKDPFLHQVYDRLGETHLQRRLRALSPWPAGVVVIQRPGMDLEALRAQFRTLRELGFSCLKQLELVPGQEWKEVYRLALEEDVRPWWYDDASSEEPTSELLGSLGVPEGLSREQVREHPAWKARQKQVWLAQLERSQAPKPVLHLAENSGLPGTLKPEQFGLTPELAARFTGWLKERYTTVAQLKEAWNFNYPMVRRRPWETWEQVEQEVVPLVTEERQEYRRIVDVLWFRARAQVEGARTELRKRREQEPLIPQRLGGEMGLFLPFAARSTDMEGIAEVMAEAGSFYPSIHPGWHYEEAAFEFVRPSYMQAALAVDWAKGLWSASWESTGGPQQLSGGKAPFVPESREQVAGFTLDENTIQQLMLSWVAAGFKGFGQWCWNARGFGWEAGEYALLDRNQEVCARTQAAGRIARACRGLRDELWSAHKEPLVGLFQDWESDAFWAAVSIGGRDMYKGFPARARIGAARALIDANVPWEHVTARNLRAGLADRYATIYLPAQLAVDASLLELLRAYVERGGRLVLDAPGAWYGYDGRLLPTAEGSPFERLFGCRIADYQYSRNNHCRWSLAGREVPGFILELRPTRAKVVERFDDGRPAVTEQRLGRGTAVVIAHAASLNAWRPGNEESQAALVRHSLGGRKPGYACEGALVYRLASATADHYFLMNDSPREVKVRLRTPGYRYRGPATDPLRGQSLDLTELLAIPANGARWVRCEW